LAGMQVRRSRRTGGFFYRQQKPARICCADREVPAYNNSTGPSLICRRTPAHRKMVVLGPRSARTRTFGGTVPDPDRPRAADDRAPFADDTDPAALVQGALGLHAADATEPVDPEGGSSPDDALGLYLRQMGAIPLLSRAQELTLARRLEHTRRRFRRA